MKVQLNSQELKLKIQRRKNKRMKRVMKSKVPLLFMILEVRYGWTRKSKSN